MDMDTNTNTNKNKNLNLHKVREHPVFPSGCLTSLLKGAAEIQKQRSLDFLFFTHPVVPRAEVQHLNLPYAN
jgi:hypothetical protein